jgi:hypothetical protein
VARVRVHPSFGAQALRNPRRQPHRGAPVHPDQAGVQGAPVASDRQAAVQLARDPDGFHRRGIHPRFARGPQHGLAEGLLPVRGILLGPAGPRMAGRVAFEGAPGGPQAAVQQEDLDALRAQIDAGDHGADSITAAPLIEAPPALA